MARPRSRPETQARIVDTARGLFAERGFQATTVRAIASAADVDPALIYHYFGDKRGLFDAVLAPPAQSVAVIERIMADDRDRPTAFLDAVLRTWDADLEVRTHMVALLRAALLDERSAAGLQALITNLAVGVFGDVMAPDHRELRIALVSSQVSGLLLRRYVVIDPHLAEQPVESVVAVMAPLIDRIVTGDLPASSPS